MDKVKLLEEYERKIGKAWAQWGSQEVMGFYAFMKKSGR